MRALLTWRTARKRYRCEFCRQVINPGERYVSGALPPNSDIGNTTWWHSASHGEDGNACAAYDEEGDEHYLGQRAGEDDWPDRGAAENAL